MQPVNPTVTWPNHTSIVTGVTPAKHSVLYNGAPVRGGEGQPLRINPYVPKHELVVGETLYDAAHKAGLTTAEVDWVAIEKAENITWPFPEWPSVDNAVVREIPRGRVATYGQVARLAGLGRSARLVGYALHSLWHGSAMPWQRVVNASGAISRRAEEGPETLQRLRLEEEGIVFDAKGRVDLARWQWKPRQRPQGVSRRSPADGPKDRGPR